MESPIKKIFRVLAKPLFDVGPVESDKPDVGRRTKQNSAYEMRTAVRLLQSALTSLQETCDEWFSKDGGTRSHFEYRVSYLRKNVYEALLELNALDQPYENTWRNAMVTVRAVEYQVNYTWENVANLSDRHVEFSVREKNQAIEGPLQTFSSASISISANGGGALIAENLKQG